MKTIEFKDTLLVVSNIAAVRLVEPGIGGTHHLEVLVVGASQPWVIPGGLGEYQQIKKALEAAP